MDERESKRVVVVDDEGRTEILWSWRVDGGWELADPPFDVVGLSRGDVVEASPGPTPNT